MDDNGPLSGARLTACVLVYRGDVDIEWVDEMFRFSVLTSWDKFERLVIAQREENEYPHLMEWHQWLAERLRERLEGDSEGPAYEAHRDWVPD